MKRVMIIAEAGVNHNGDIQLAKRLIDVAVEAKADVVKFQTFKAENIVTDEAPKATYQKETTDSNESQYRMLKKLELSVEDHKELIAYCKEKGILFLSTPFDLESIDLLDDLGIEIFKIPSGELTNLPYLEKIGAKKKQVILSTGMSTIDEVEAAIRILNNQGTTDITLLHCTTQYPTPMEEVNLKAMLTMKERFGLEVGYSDHTEGIEVPIAAVAMGATVIEKHFSLDKNMEGPDHRASLEPNELIKMVQAIRNIEKALGNGEKVPSKCELQNKEIVRKSIVAKVSIQEGELFSEDNLTVKRPGSGISPMRWHEVLGRRATKNYVKDEMIIL
nr:N-acetylneuraminate synthase [uncultured Niameybacter sp.]